MDRKNRGQTPPTTLGREEIERIFATALRRIGGIPKLAQTPEGRSALIASCALETIAILSALSAQHEADRARIGELEAALNATANALHNARLSIALQLSPHHEDVLDGSKALAIAVRALLNPEQSQ